MRKVYRLVSFFVFFIRSVSNSGPCKRMKLKTSNFKLQMVK